MTVENRAKQFAPFSAITGLDRALEKKRRELDHCGRRELSEESAAELDARLRSLRRGERVSVCFYSGQEYRHVSGSVERLEEAEGLLKLGGVRIPLTDIAELAPAEPCQPGENAL
jgi:hypothetical protein